MLLCVAYRAAAGPCDVAEVCSGMDKECPLDSFKPQSTTCRCVTESRKTTHGLACEQGPAHRSSTDMIDHTQRLYVNFVPGC